MQKKHRFLLKIPLIPNILEAFSLCDNSKNIKIHKGCEIIE